MRRVARRLQVGGAVLALLALGTGAALAADATVTTGAGDNFQIVEPTIPEGGSLDFRNDQAKPHNLVAAARGPDGRPLFRTPTFSGPGATRPVAGVQYLTQGRYPFVCTIHPGMDSNLNVSAAGTPKARPRIDVSIPAQTVERVRGRGRLMVRVRALTRSPGISLVAKKGRRVLARKKLSLPAGAQRTLPMRLTNAGKRALRRLRTATVVVNGSVPFGRPDRAARRLG